MKNFPFPLPSLPLPKKFTYDKALRYIQKNKGLSKKQLIEKCEITPADYTTFTSGKTPSPELIEKICQKLGVDLNIFLFLAINPIEIKNLEKRRLARKIQSELKRFYKKE